MRRTCSPEFASLLLVAALVAWAASVEAEAEPLVTEAEAEPFVTGAEAEPPNSFAGAELSADELLEALATSRSRQFKPIGRTSVLFRMRTESRVTAGFKVESHASHHGYRCEIAAYRVSRLLGLDTVPPTVFRQATRREIKSRFHKEKTGRWKEVANATVWRDNGVVDGAASFWIKSPKRRLSSKRGAWQPWLRVDMPIPDGSTELARDLSSMIVFDFLVANWDRYSGGNLLMSPGGDRAILIDHDAAFSRLNEPLYRRLLDELMRTERFSAALVERLTALDAEAIEAELAEDPGHAAEPLLNDAQIAALLDRRQTVLSHVAALIDEHGSDRVLFFP
ncbi:MAG: hypothetical protein AAF436_04675 [Myxococcota bacterium]